MTRDKRPDEVIPVYKVDLDTVAGRSPSVVIPQRVAELTDREPNELEPLWNSIDPEALDSFVARTTESATPCRLAFQYEGCTVEIRDDDWLRIAPSDETPILSA